MVNQDFIRSYSIKTTKSGLKVPVVNDVHLHSIYDPEREASIFIDAQRNQIKLKNEFLVLGLGFGYHVKELIKVAREMGKPFKIVVIEPNDQVAQDCLSEGYISENEVYICSGKSAREFYQNRDLVHFLLKKPAIINHAASFNLYQDYFRELLAYEADQATGHSIENTQSLELKEYLSSLDQEKTLWENVQEISHRPSFNDDLDFLMMAFLNMTEKSNAMTEAQR